MEMIETELCRFQELLRSALADLDTIAAEPTPYESDTRLVAVYRKLAGDGAKHIRDKLRAAGYRP